MAATQKMIINVLDENDNAPKFPQPKQYNFAIPEVRVDLLIETACSLELRRSFVFFLFPFFFCALFSLYNWTSVYVCMCYAMIFRQFCYTNVRRF